MFSIVTAYTDHIAELERQLAEAQARYEADKQRGHKYRDKLMSQLAEANGRVAALTTRRSAWNEESEHADKAVNAQIGRAHV